MLNQLNEKAKKGDTIIEVLIAISVLGFIIMAMLQVMQQGMSAAQMALEINLVRNQMNNQAEALRMINAAAQHRKRDSEAGETTQYSKLWSELIQGAESSDAVADWEQVDAYDHKLKRRVCNQPDKKFIIDIRNLPNVGSIKRGSGTAGGVFAEPTVFSRIVYGKDPTDSGDGNLINGGLKFIRSEGIWIQAQRVEKSTKETDRTTKAYDFHIRACWETPGRNQPMKLGTIVRLHYPEIEGVD